MCHGDNTHCDRRGMIATEKSADMYSLRTLYARGVSVASKGWSSAYASLGVVFPSRLHYPPYRAVVGPGWPV